MPHGADYVGMQKFISALAHSYGVSDSDLGDGGTYVNSSTDFNSPFRYPRRDPEFRMVGFGSVVGIVASDDYLIYAMSTRQSAREWFASPTLGDLSSIAAECGQRLSEINHRFVAQPDLINAPIAQSQKYSFTRIDRNEIRNLFDETAYFRNALSYGRRPERPDSRAFVAQDGSRIIGIAGASEDADGLFQIGVDVLDEYRGRRIGTTVVSLLAKSIIEDGGVPFYSTSSSNIISQRLCISAGFRPTCIEIYAYDISEYENR